MKETKEPVIPEVQSDAYKLDPGWNEVPRWFPRGIHPKTGKQDYGDGGSRTVAVRQARQMIATGWTDVVVEKRYYS